jgi:hypothetical protein
LALCVVALAVGEDLQNLRVQQPEVVEMGAFLVVAAAAVALVLP